LLKSFFCKANVDVKSGRSSVQRVTSIVTLRSLEKVSMIVSDKTKIIKARPIYKKGRKIYNAVYHTYLGHKFVQPCEIPGTFQRQNYVERNILS